MKKYTYLIASISLAFFASSCGSDEKKAIVDNSVAIMVKTSAVQADGSNPFLTVSGKIQAANSAELSTRTMGHVNKIHVNVGDRVRKGQLLVSINNVDLQAKRGQVKAGITEATAAFNNAKKDYDRFKSLFAENSASQKELDDITSNYEMAKARLEGANQMKNEINAQFSYTNITAPFSGKVTNKYIKTGDMANPGMPLIAIETPGDFEVSAMVPESEISNIKAGAIVDVIVKSIDQTVKGKVTEVSTSSKNTGGQFLVKIALDKTEANILSGMFTSVNFPLEKKEQAKTTMVLVSQEAIVNRGQLSGIYTVSQSNTALLRWLRLGRTYGDKVEVLSGLTADEAYITSAEGKLFNGAKITVQ